MAPAGAEARFLPVWRGGGAGAAGVCIRLPHSWHPPHFLLEASLILLCRGSHPWARGRGVSFSIRPHCPWGRSVKRREGSPLGWSPLPCPSAHPFSLLLSSACPLFGCISPFIPRLVSLLPSQSPRSRSPLLGPFPSFLPYQLSTFTPCFSLPRPASLPLSSSLLPSLLSPPPSLFSILFCLPSPFPLPWLRRPLPGGVEMSGWSGPRPCLFPGLWACSQALWVETGSEGGNI